MKKIPSKNYLILFVILGVTVALVLYARSWYIMSKEYYMQNSVIKEVAGEINDNEFDSYAIENQKFILYVSSGHDVDIKDFENNLKELIAKLNIQDSFVYINMDNIDMGLFNNKLKNNYSLDDRIASQISSKNVNAIYFFENGRVSLIINNPDKYRITYVEKILKDWKLRND